jgi:hypothetical protein
MAATMAGTSTGNSNTVEISTEPCGYKGDMMSGTAAPTMMATQAMMAATAAASMTGEGGCLLGAVLLSTNETTGGPKDAYGVSFVTVDDTTGQVCYEIQAAGLKLPAKAAHIHKGLKGKDGDVVVPFTSAPDANGFSGGCVKADKTLVGDIADNPSNYYVNVHTSDFAAGAIRGQLGAPMTADLEGANESTGGAKDGKGVAVVLIDGTTVCYALDVDGITLPAKADHIHKGAKGVDGDVVIPFPTAPDANGYAIGCAVNQKADVTADVLANPSNYYVNVHTSDFAAGAVRGQIEK